MEPALSPLPGSERATFPEKENTVMVTSEPSARTQTAQGTDAGVVHERSLRVGPFHTRYLEAGDPGAPPVLLLHDGAWGGSSSVTWGKLIPALADDYHIIAPDLLGFGGTDKAVFVDRSPYEFRIEHVRALLDALQVRRPFHVVGNSFGGSLALYAAGAGDLLDMRSAVSINGTGGPWRTELALAELGRWDGTEDDIRRVARLLIDEGPDFEEQVAARTYWASRPGHYRAVKAPGIELPEPLVTAGAERTWPAVLATATIPILLTSGSRDPLLEPDWTERITSVSKSATAVEMDCKHAPNIDHVADLLAVLRPFLAAN